jgi:hypothetical protein
MGKTCVLSKEGLKLFNLAHVERSRLRKVLHDLFGSDYDQRLDAMLGRSREATKALIALCDQGCTDGTMLRDRNNTVAALCERGIENVVRLIVSDAKKKRHTARSNYRFCADVARRAHAEGDHQTAMTHYRALTNAQTAALGFQLPKRMRGLFATLGHDYDDVVAHLEKISSVGFDEHCLPSVVAIAEYMVSRRRGGKQLRADVMEVLTIYGYIYYLLDFQLLPQYRTLYRSVTI